MKKLLFAVLLLVSIASAEVSQQQAGVICNPYSLDGETIQVTGPLSCEGLYWTCGFMYYGNDQNIMIAVDQNSGAVIPASDDLFADVASTKYAIDNGASYIFGNFLSDSSFGLEMAGMNATLQNYQNLLKSLKDDGTITAAKFTDFKNIINNVRASSLQLSGKVFALNNESTAFWESPDCIKLMDYLRNMNESLLLAENFSSSWNGFITEYNRLAVSLENVRVAVINPSDSQILSQNIEALKVKIDNYANDESEFVNTLTANLATRADKKTTKDKLDEAYSIVKNSQNANATEKYNEASSAFGRGEYSKARGLINEALALAAIEPVNGDGGTVADMPTDYSVFLILIGLLVIVLLFLNFFKKKEPDDEEKEGNEQRGREQRDKGLRGKWQKPAGKKADWSWSNDDTSSIGRKASRV